MAFHAAAYRYLHRDEAANLDQKPDQATTADDSPEHCKTGT